MRPCRARP